MRPLLLEAGCQVRSRVHPLTITTSRCVRCDLSPFPRARKVRVKADPIFVGRAFEGWVICGVSESVNIRVGSVRFAFALFYVAVLQALALLAASRQEIDSVSYRGGDRSRKHAG